MTAAQSVHTSSCRRRYFSPDATRSEFRRWLPQSSSFVVVRAAIGTLVILGATLAPEALTAQASSRIIGPTLAVGAAVPNDLTELGGVATPMIGAGAGVLFDVASVVIRPVVRLTGSTPGDVDPTLRAPCVDSSGQQQPCAIVPPYARWYVRPGIDVLVPTATARIFGALGIGWAWLPGGALRPNAGSENAALPSGRGYARGAIGTRLGGAARAPRLELAVSQFTTSAGAVRRLLEVELWFR